MAGTGLLSDAELGELSQRFEREAPSTIVGWAVDTFGDRILIAASFQDAVLIDIATKVEPSIEVVFIDTGYHFSETLDTVERVRARYDLNLRVMKVPTPAVPLYESDPSNCCSTAKVEQLELALDGKLAWMSGLRRVEAVTRGDAPIVARDKRGLVKINPLATWTDLDVRGYIADHDVPYNPLLDQGYPSIGCAPCTKPVADGADPRAGRWSGMDRTECGLHT